MSPDHRPSDLTPVDPVIDAMLSFEPQVMGIMHSTINTIWPGVQHLFGEWDGPVMAYAETTNNNGVPPEDYAEHCRRWVEQGVQIVGGCCGTTIDHIKAIAARLPEKVGERSAA